MESEHLLGHARLGHARLGNACFGTKYKNSAAGFHSAAEFSAAEVYSSLWQIPLGFLQRSRTCGHMAAASASCSSELLQLYEGIFGLEEAAASASCSSELLRLYEGILGLEEAAASASCSSELLRTEQVPPSAWRGQGPTASLGPIAAS